MAFLLLLMESKKTHSKTDRVVALKPLYSQGPLIPHLTQSYLPGGWGSVELSAALPPLPDSDPHLSLCLRCGAQS